MNGWCSFYTVVQCLFLMPFGIIPHCLAFISRQLVSVVQSNSDCMCNGYPTHITTIATATKNNNNNKSSSFYYFLFHIFHTFSWSHDALMILIFIGLSSCRCYSSSYHIMFSGNVPFYRPVFIAPCNCTVQCTHMCVGGGERALVRYIKYNRYIIPGDNCLFCDHRVRFSPHCKLAESVTISFSTRCVCASAIVFGLMKMRLTISAVPHRFTIQQKVIYTMYFKEIDMQTQYYPHIHAEYMSVGGVKWTEKRFNELDTSTYIAH